MKIMTVKDAAAGGKVAFEILFEKVAAGAKTLGLATGSSPLTLYQEMRSSDLDFSEMTSINLDEYIGLPASHPQSYDYFMKEHLFQDKPFKDSFLPNGLAEDLEAEVKRYDAVLDRYPIDLQVLGIGRNGHIGFNEPGTSFDITTHVVDLANNTIEANSRFFDRMEDVPKQAISMGISSIMKSKTILLLAFGEEKAEALAKMVNGPITEELPASILQKHQDVIVIADQAASSQLNL